MQEILRRNRIEVIFYIFELSTFDYLGHQVDQLLGLGTPVNIIHLE
jgi:hypothetical protein